MLFALLHFVWRELCVLYCTERMKKQFEFSMILTFRRSSLIFNVKSTDKKNTWIFLPTIHTFVSIVTIGVCDI